MVTKTHNCNAIVFTCIDSRLHPQVENYFKKKYKNFDLCSTAGAIKGFADPKTRNFFLKQLEISQKLHHPKYIILTMHRDCGAYGGSMAFSNPKIETEHHQKELERVARITRQKFPNLKIYKYFLDLVFKKNEWTCEPKLVQ